MSEKAKEEDLMLPTTTNNEKIAESQQEEDGPNNSKTDQIQRYLITTVLCVSYLCLVWQHETYSIFHILSNKII